MFGQLSRVILVWFVNLQLDCQSRIGHRKDRKIFAGKFPVRKALRNRFVSIDWVDLIFEKERRTLIWHFEDKSESIILDGWAWTKSSIKSLAGNMSRHSCIEPTENEWFIERSRLEVNHKRFSSVEHQESQELRAKTVYWTVWLLGTQEVKQP